MTDELNDCVLEALAARIYQYRLLHIVFGSKPSEVELSLLAGQETADACAALADAGYETEGLLTTAMRPFAEKLASPAFLDDLRGQYARLFVVPGDDCVKPWESVYATAEATLFTRCTLDVRARYRELGFRAQEKGHFPEDHLSMMLDFMAAVSERVYEAAAADDEARAARLLDAQTAFVRVHLGDWVGKLTVALEERDATGFFAACARVTQTFASSDERLMGQLAAALSS